MSQLRQTTRYFQRHGIIIFHQTGLAQGAYSVISKSICHFQLLPLSQHTSGVREIALGPLAVHVSNLHIYTEYISSSPQRYLNDSPQPLD